MLEWMITYTSSQHLELDDPSDGAEAREEFADFDIELDPEVDEPPFEVSISNKVVAFNELLDEEDWYDPSDGEYELSSAVNYWICDTTCAPDYADFVSESCDYDVLQVSSS